MALEDEGIAFLLKADIRLQREAQCHTPEERYLQSHLCKTSKLVTQCYCVQVDHQMRSYTVTLLWLLGKSRALRFCQPEY